MIYFVTYDISNPKRLSKVSKMLENFGFRVQYSFFECEMEKSKMTEIKAALLDVINLKEDSLKIYPLCSDCLKNVSSVGNGSVFIPQTFMIL